MKPVKAWAILNAGRMKAHQGELPVYWYRVTAKREAERIFKSGNYEIVRIEIRELKPKRKSKT